MIGDVAESLSLKFGKIPPKIKNDLKQLSKHLVLKNVMKLSDKYIYLIQTQRQDIG